MLRLTLQCFAVSTILSFSCVSPAQSLVVTPATLSFTAKADSLELPPAQTFQVTASDGSAVPFTLSGALYGQGTRVNYVTVSPYTGITPATVTVSLNNGIVQASPVTDLPITLLFEERTGSTEPTPGIPTALLTVRLTLTPPPPPVISAVLNAATFRSDSLAPLEIVSIFGSNLGQLTDSTKVTFVGLVGASYYQSTSGGTRVFFNGIPASILFANATQINAIVPSKLTGTGTVDVAVQHYQQTTDTLRFNQTTASPGLFTISQTGDGLAFVLNSDNSLNSISSPAPRGTVIQLFGAGCGILTPPPLFSDTLEGIIVPISNQNSYPVPAAPVSVSIGGKDAAIVYAGPIPNSVYGLCQFNVRVPTDVEPGLQPVLLKIGQIQNNQKTSAAIR